MKSVYKYYSGQYHDSMIKGDVYLNTFSNIRQMDDEKLIGDSEEASATNHFVNFHTSDSNDFPAIGDMTYGLINVGNVGGVYVNNVKFSQELEDAYMYCVTKERNDLLWERIGYDKCMEILNFGLFRKRVGEALWCSGIQTMGDGGDCDYRSNMGIISSSERSPQRPNYFMKSVKHKHQAEKRAIYIPLEEDKVIEPVTVRIDLSDIVRFL